MLVTTILFLTNITPDWSNICWAPKPYGSVNYCV